MTLRHGSLFTGVRGLDLAVEQVFGSTAAWHSEIDPGACKVLAHHTPDVPNLGDISTIDWAAVEPVDIICGGFPCQDISSAGKGAGIKEGTRSGLWYRYADAIRVLRPRYVVVENVRALLVRGLDIVLGDLAELGYVGSWGCLPASAVGAPHQRQRVFLVAEDARCGQWAAEGRGEADGAQLHRSTGVAPRSDRSPGSVELLPTPVVNDMGDGKTVEWWDEWIEACKAKHGNGNGHGRSLAIEARSLPTPTATDASGSRGRRHDGSKYTPTSGVTLTDAITSEPWGSYGPAIDCWSSILGRQAPSPTDDQGRLSPPFVEWMMGWPAGHVTDCDITRTQQLKACGNGVVTLQAIAALGSLLPRLPNRVRLHPVALSEGVTDQPGQPRSGIDPLGNVVVVEGEGERDVHAGDPDARAQDVKPDRVAS